MAAEEEAREEEVIPCDCKNCHRADREVEAGNRVIKTVHASVGGGKTLRTLREAVRVRRDHVG